MKLPDGSHLTYCSNIHPGESWADVRANVERFYPAVRDRLESLAPFGIGLRLSAQAARELSAPGMLEEFLAFLKQRNLYVFTLNGFPYGTFHGKRVKDDVYLPDWRDPERLRYSNQLADLLSAMLVDESVGEGSISTVPGAYKNALSAPQDLQAIADNLIAHIAHLVALQRKTGRLITLALEPEPCCLLETIDETVDFFRRFLFDGSAIQRLQALCDLDADAAAVAMRRHLGVCLDLCHAAVEFEDPQGCINQLEHAGIRILKMQISSGLRVASMSDASEQALRQFNDPVYLHQVVEMRDGSLTRHADLPAAFAARQPGKSPAEWRVHFHVPIFLDQMETFQSTRFFIEEVLARHRWNPICTHLEVETYTWDVLPPQYRGITMESAIARELRWVQARLAP